MKYIAESNGTKWYVFDTDGMCCHAGPLSEHAALELATTLNRGEAIDRPSTTKNNKV
jgi:hypothetical protein